MSAHKLQSDIDAYVATTGNTVDLGGADNNTVVADVISERTSATGVTIDGGLAKDGRFAALATAAMFVSAEVTGNGSSQDTAHGLVTTPSVVIAFFTELDGNAADLAYGTHDATNCKITATSGQKYRIFALK